jgi:hypothetical protein
MNIEVSPEVLVTQLGYSNNKSSINKAEKIISNTNQFNKFSKHIISFHDQIKKMNAYITFSNKQSYLKIKCDENDSKQILEEFHNEVKNWSAKYDLELKKIDERPIYYILGKN